VTAQYNVDTSLDCQIIQIGANIIDQFDVDGYPTRIRSCPIRASFAASKTCLFLPRALCALEGRESRDHVPDPSRRSIDGFRLSFPDHRRQGRDDADPEIWNPHFFDPSATSDELDRILGEPRPDDSALCLYSPHEPRTGILPVRLTHTTYEIRNKIRAHIHRTLLRARLPAAIPR
jgi:hypothetical protein